MLCNAYSGTHGAHHGSPTLHSMMQHLKAFVTPPSVHAQQHLAFSKKCINRRLPAKSYLHTDSCNKINGRGPRTCPASPPLCCWRFPGRPHALLSTPGSPLLTNNNLQLRVQVCHSLSQLCKPLNHAEKQTCDIEQSTICIHRVIVWKEGSRAISSKSRYASTELFL